MSPTDVIPPLQRSDEVSERADAGPVQGEGRAARSTGAIPVVPVAKPPVSPRVVVSMGPHTGAAECEGCDWESEAEDVVRLPDEARTHVKRTGHRVRMERTRIEYLEAVPA